MAECPRSYKSYAVGIICALAVEKAAVEVLLDEKHPRLDPLPGDENDYTLGSMSGHDIAVACLPAGLTGKVSTATVAKDMLRSFPIKVGLMVGIGGGVPSKKHDIRLGDVVVSQPDGQHGGVVQWDFGKTEQGGVFRRTGSLNKPPRVLLNALQRLKTDHQIYGNTLPAHLSTLITRGPHMAATFHHQGTENDQLYQASYQHVHGETCENCDPSNLVERLDLGTSTAPRIFYGDIASGDQVMRDGLTRDRIAATEGVICFEMEAAGLTDDFPCVVVRGICDYADSHKNKEWQPYAAATAAAYAKELLGMIDTVGVEALEPASE